MSFGFDKNNKTILICGLFVLFALGIGFGGLLNFTKPPAKDVTHTECLERRESYHPNIENTCKFTLDICPAPLREYNIE